MSVIEEGPLRGAFRGFKNRETFFEFQAGGVWRQNQYKYQYFYAYMPRARVTDDGGRLMLHVEGMSDTVEVVRPRKSDLPREAD